MLCHLILVNWRKLNALQDERQHKKNWDLREAVKSESQKVKNLIM